MKISGYGLALAGILIIVGGLAGCTASSSTSRAEAEIAAQPESSADPPLRLTVEEWNEIKQAVNGDSLDEEPRPLKITLPTYPDGEDRPETIPAVHVGIYEFLPGKRNGEPVEAAMEVSIRFKLHGD